MASIVTGLIPVFQPAVNAFIGAEWHSTTRQLGADIQHFRVNFVFIPQDPGGGSTFITNTASFGITDRYPGQWGPFSVIFGPSFGWSAQTDLFSVANFTASLVNDTVYNYG